MSRLPLKIVIVGAGSVAFTPSLISGFSVDPRYRRATIGLVDINPEILDVVRRFAQRVSDELGLDWTIEASTDRREVLAGADIVTTSIGVGGVDVWALDVDIPYKYGIIQPVGDTSGPGGLARALRHVPVLVEIGWDMEELCPNAAFYNFANPLTVNAQAINKLTKIQCVGLCIGVDITWDYLCQLLGVNKQHTSIIAGGINHCHWITDFRLLGEDAFPIVRAALDEQEGKPMEMEYFRAKYPQIAPRAQEPQDRQPLCSTLFRKFGAYPGPGEGHVGEFFPQLMRPLISDVEKFQGGSIRWVHQSYPLLVQKMKDIAAGRVPIEAETFARELAWEHTQLLGIIASRQDNLGKTFFINLPNRGMITNLPAEAVVEIPATADAAGLHPFALGDLPKAVVPTLAHKIASLDLIIEAAMEGSRQKAVQALINDPHCTDMAAAERMVNELIDAELDYLPRFR
jgi:alpha-galactosidase